MLRPNITESELIHADQSSLSTALRQIDEAINTLAMERNFMPLGDDDYLFRDAASDLCRARFLLIEYMASFAEKWGAGEVPAQLVAASEMADTLEYFYSVVRKHRRAILQRFNDELATCDAVEAAKRKD